MNGEKCLILVFLLLISKAVSDTKNSTRKRLEGPFIVGGNPAQEGQFPYQVYLFIQDSILCGGSIVSEQYILTAAHCTDRKLPADIKVVAGTTRFQSPSKDEINVRAIFQHQQYDGNTFRNDISVLQLETNLTFGRNINKINLPSSSFQQGTRCTVSGWGTTVDEGQVISPELRFVELPLVSNADCEAKTGWKIPSSQICAGYPEGQKDACQGDSGGPLAFDDYVVGIVSYGKGCARPELPGVYTNVAYYKGWIEDIIKNASTVTYPDYMILFFIIVLYSNFNYL